MSGHAVPSILRRPRTWLLVGVVVAAIAVPSAVGAAESPIRACVKSQGGTLRIVSATAACATGEKLLTWSKSGVAGPTGPAGSTGTAGAAGPTGPAGQTGQNGQNGQNGGQGVAGPTGPQGIAGPTGPAGSPGSPGSGGEKTPLGQSAFMRCTGIDGNATGKSIEVYSYSWGIQSPRDLATGQASGKRQHKPFIITKELDRSTPLLFNKLVNNSTIPFCVIQFVHKMSDGSSEPYMTITLTNAQVSEVVSHKGDTRSPEVRQLNETEEVSFTYQKITWEAIDGGITAEDSWEAPVT
jgi:type VI secretion system secreted protein Hcp